MKIGSSGLLTWPLDIGAGGGSGCDHVQRPGYAVKSTGLHLRDDLNPLHDDLKRVMSQKPPMSTKPSRREGRFNESMFMLTRPYWLVL